MGAIAAAVLLSLVGLLVVPAAAQPVQPNASHHSGIVGGPTDDISSGGKGASVSSRAAAAKPTNATASPSWGLREVKADGVEGSIVFVAYAVAFRPPFSSGFQEQVIACLESARRMHPSMHAVMLTDSSTQMPMVEAVGPWVKLVRYTVAVPEKEGQLMYQRLALELRYMEGLLSDLTAPRPHIAFIDLDLLFVRPLPMLELPSEEWHVGLTVRNKDYNPINLGLKLVNRAHLAEAATLWRNVHKKMRKSYGDDGGNMAFKDDQDMFSKAIKMGAPNPFKGAGKKRITITYDRSMSKRSAAAAGGSSNISSSSSSSRSSSSHLPVLITMLPCVEFNAIPGGGHTYGCLCKAGSSRMLHFKGGLKGLMVPWWKRIRDTSWSLGGSPCSKRQGKKG